MRTYVVRWKTTFREDLASRLQNTKLGSTLLSKSDREEVWATPGGMLQELSQDGLRL